MASSDDWRRPDDRQARHGWTPTRLFITDRRTVELHETSASRLVDAPHASAMPCYEIAPSRNHHHLALAGYVSGIGEPTMRMFETVTSSLLVIAAQALVVGVVVSTF